MLRDLNPSVASSQHDPVTSLARRDPSTALGMTIGHGTLRRGAVACLMAAEAAMPVGWVRLVSPFPGNSEARALPVAVSARSARGPASTRSSPERPGPTQTIVDLSLIILFLLFLAMKPEKHDVFCGYSGSDATPLGLMDFLVPLSRGRLHCVTPTPG